MKEEPKDSEREQKDNNKEIIKPECCDIVHFIIIYIVLSCILTFFITKIAHYFIFDSQQLIVILNIISIVIASLPLLILTIQKVSVGGFSLELKQKKKEIEDRLQELDKKLAGITEFFNKETATINNTTREVLSLLLLKTLLVLFKINDTESKIAMSTNKQVTIVNANMFNTYVENQLPYLFQIFHSSCPKTQESEIYLIKNILSSLINFLVSGYIIDLLYYIFYNHQYTISKSQEDAIKIFQNIFYLIHNPITNDNSYFIAKFTVCPTSIDSFLNCIFENEQIPTPQMREEMKCLLTEYIHLIQKYQEYQNNPLTWIEQFKDKNIQIVV